MRKHICLVILPLLAGCGGSDDEAEATAHASKPKVVSSEVVNTSGVTLSATEDSDEDEDAGYVPPFIDNEARDPFAPPAILPDVVEEEPEPEPEYTPPPSLPPLKLLGFIDVDSPRAMLKVEGDLVLVGAGDRVRNIDILSVDSPAITIKFGNDQIAMNLHKPPTNGDSGGGSNMRGARNTSPATPILHRSPRVGNPALPSVTTPALPRAPGPSLPPLPAVGITPPAPSAG